MLVLYFDGGASCISGAPGSVVHLCSIIKLAENRKLSLKETGKLFAHKLGKEIISFLFNRRIGHIFAITVEN